MRHLLRSYMHYYNGARLCLWARTRPYREPFRSSDAFCPYQFLADYTINMFGSNFRQGQGQPFYCWCPGCGGLIV